MGHGHGCASRHMYQFQMQKTKIQHEVFNLFNLNMKFEPGFYFVGLLNNEHWMLNYSCVKHLHVTGEPDCCLSWCLDVQGLIVATISFLVFLKA